MTLKVIRRFSAPTCSEAGLLDGVEGFCDANGAVSTVRPHVIPWHVSYLLHVLIPYAVSCFGTPLRPKSVAQGYYDALCTTLFAGKKNVPSSEIPGMSWYIT